MVAGIDGKDSYGRTALWNAGAAGSLEVSRLLIGAGAKVSAGDRDKSWEMNAEEIAVLFNQPRDVEQTIGAAMDVTRWEVHSREAGCGSLP